MGREMISLGSGGIEPSYPARKPPQPGGLQQLRAILWRQRMVLAGSLFAALALGILAIFLLPEKYTATASVQIEQQAPQVIAVPDLDPEADDTARFLQTQLDKVRSRSLAQDVIDRLALAGSPRALEALGLETPDREETIRKLQENVLAELGLDTRLARISFVSRDPQVSAAIANAYAEALIAENVRGKVETSDNAQRYLLEQLDEAKVKLEESERRLLGYARSAGLTGTALPDAAAMGSEPAQQLAQLTNSLAAATARRIDAQQEWAQISGAPPESLSQVQENRAYQELLAEKARLQAALAEDRQRHTDEYPSVIATRAQIEQINRQIDTLASNIRRGFSQRYQAAARQEAQLEATVAGLRGESMAEQERGVGYNSLQREVETNRVSYDGLLQRYREISAAAGAPAANITLVDRAEPPLDPSSPNKPWILALAALCGLIGGMALALLREQVNSPIRSTEDVLVSQDISVLGIVPALRGADTMADALRSPRSPQSEAYNSLAATLQHAMHGELPRTVLVTSTQAREGKSTSVWGLARGLRTIGYRVLVVNADIRKPSREAGLSEVLAGARSVRSVLQTQERSGLQLINAGRAEYDPISLLTPARVKPILAELAGMADIVVIDGPPILGLADAPLLAESVDAALAVIEAGRTTAQELDTALARLPAKLPVAGLLTKFDAREAGAKYGGHEYFRYGEQTDTLVPA